MSSSFPAADTIRPNGGCMQGTHVEGFAEVLQRLPGERKAIAADLGLPYRTFSNYVVGLQSFPPDLISRLYAVTGERAILDFILEPLDMVAVSKTRPNDVQKTEAPDVYRYLMDAVERLGKVTHEIREAKDDGSPAGAKIDPSEYGRIAYFLRDIERLCGQIRESIKSEVKS